MNTLYWITVVGNINVALVVLIIFGALSLVVWIISSANIKYFGDDNGCYEDEKRVWLEIKKFTKPLSIIGILSLFLYCFVPTTKEALLIYGVGETLDYLKSNKTAKEIPDKAIIALDKYLDSFKEDETPESKEK